MPLDPGILRKLAGKALAVSHVVYRVAILAGAGSAESALDYQPVKQRRHDRILAGERLGRRPSGDVVPAVELLQPLTDELRGGLQVAPGGEESQRPE
jgi:hypothetical protein